MVPIPATFRPMPVSAKLNALRDARHAAYTAWAASIGKPEAVALHVALVEAGNAVLDEVSKHYRR